MAFRAWVGALLLATRLVVAPALASASGMPVVDVANLTQSIITTLETIEQTSQAVLDYQIYLQQLERMVTDMAVPGFYIWDQVDRIRDKGGRIVRGVGSARLDVDDLESFAKKFTTREYYRQSGCYGRDAHCGLNKLNGFIKGLEDGRLLGLERHAQALDAAYARLTERAEDEASGDDAKKVEILRQRVASARGKLEAIQHQTEFIDMMLDQVRQMKELMEEYQRVQVMQMMMDAAARVEAESLSRRYFRDVYILRGREP